MKHVDTQSRSDNSRDATDGKGPSSDNDVVPATGWSLDAMREPCAWCTAAQELQSQHGDENDSCADALTKEHCTVATHWLREANSTSTALGAINTGTCTHVPATTTTAWRLTVGANGDDKVEVTSTRRVSMLTVGARALARTLTEQTSTPDHPGSAE